VLGLHIIAVDTYRCTLYVHKLTHTWGLGISLALDFSKRERRVLHSNDAQTCVFADALCLQIVVYGYTGFPGWQWLCRAHAQVGCAISLADTVRNSLQLIDTIHTSMCTSPCVHTTGMRRYWEVLDCAQCGAWRSATARGWTLGQQSFCGDDGC
jgi:hypothetical protein